MSNEPVPVTVLLTFGDQAELLTPAGTPDNPLRVPAADITADTEIMITCPCPSSR